MEVKWREEEEERSGKTRGNTLVIALIQIELEHSPLIRSKGVLKKGRERERKRVRKRVRKRERERESGGGGGKGRGGGGVI